MERSKRLQLQLVHVQPGLLAARDVDSLLLQLSLSGGLQVLPHGPVG